MRNLFLMLVSSFCLLGCLEFDLLVKVNRDGSGTIEQTVLMNKALINQMQDFSDSFGDKNKKKFSLIDKKTLIKDATKMGEGVYFQYVKSISEKEREGYKAHYSFKDINTLKLNQNPSDKIPLPSDGESKSPNESFTFSFQRADQPTLTIRQPDITFSPDSTSDNLEEPPAAADDTSGIDMMMEMFKGLRVSIAVEVKGTILKTNAAYADANRVTLMEMDFERIIHDREKFAVISKQKPKTMEEAKQLLKDIPGIKFEMAKETMIQFR
jgi:hypothetical protein